MLNRMKLQAGVVALIAGLAISAPAYAAQAATPKAATKSPIKTALNGKAKGNPAAVPRTMESVRDALYAEFRVLEDTGRDSPGLGKYLSVCRQMQAQPYLLTGSNTLKGCQPNSELVDKLLLTAHCVRFYQYLTRSAFNKVLPEHATLGEIKKVVADELHRSAGDASLLAAQLGEPQPTSGKQCHVNFRKSTRCPDGEHEEIDVLNISCDAAGSGAFYIPPGAVIRAATWSMVMSGAGENSSRNIILWPGLIADKTFGDFEDTDSNVKP